jgi:hypothetical protein
MRPRRAIRDPSLWPVRIFRLGTEPRDDLLPSTSAEQRLEMLSTLSRRAWELTGRRAKRLSRSELPVRIFHR